MTLELSNDLRVWELLAARSRSRLVEYRTHPQYSRKPILKISTTSARLSARLYIGRDAQDPRFLKLTAAQLTSLSTPSAQNFLKSPEQNYQSSLA